jgi:hypothetical protein
MRNLHLVVSYEEMHENYGALTGYERESKPRKFQYISVDTVSQIYAKVKLW